MNLSNPTEFQLRETLSLQKNSSSSLESQTPTAENRSQSESEKNIQGLLCWAY